MTCHGIYEKREELGSKRIKTLCIRLHRALETWIKLFWEGLCLIFTRRFAIIGHFLFRNGNIFQYHLNQTFKYYANIRNHEKFCIESFSSFVTLKNLKLYIETLHRRYIAFFKKDMSLYACLKKESTTQLVMTDMKRETKKDSEPRISAHGAVGHHTHVRLEWTPSLYAIYGRTRTTKGRDS